MDNAAETPVKIVNFDEDLNPHVETSSHLVSDSSEYTEQFLSQLTADPLVLSSHQVSSVLSELEPNQLTTFCSPSPSISADALPLSKTTLPPVNLQSLLDEKRQSPPPPTSSTTLPPLVIPLVVPERKYHAIKCAKVTVGHLSWYRCSACPFIASERDFIATHYMNIHVDSVAADLRCLDCEINFNRLQNLKHHYVVDHLVALSDLHSLVKLTIEANRCWSEKDRKGKPEDCPMVDSIIPEIITAEENLMEESLLLDTEPPVEVDPILPPPIVEVPLTDTHPMLTFILNKFPPEGSSNETEEENVNLETKRLDKLREEETKKAEMKAEKEKKAIWKCPVGGCSLKFTSEKNLGYHKVCHEAGTSQWKCPECLNTFVKWPNIAIHLWRNHEIDIDLYACDLCDFKSNNLSKLMKVHRKIHGNERPYLCDVCGKGFKTTKQLGTHKGLHFKSRKPALTGSVTCFICSRKFADIRLLRHHVDIVHRGIRPYLCKICNHSASSMSSLKMHLRSHTGEKPYSCPICHYTTADHNSLRRHKMKHSGDKHYKCPYCPYASIQSSTYKDHLKRKHPGLDGGLLFCCNHCSFRTVNDKIFRTHISSHLGTSSFKSQLEELAEEVVTEQAVSEAV